MLVVMNAHATEEQVRAVCKRIEELGFRPHPIPGATRTAIGITGNEGEIEPGTLDELPGVVEVIRVSKPYKLVSRDVKKTRRSLIPQRSFDRRRRTGIVAGPCAIESASRLSRLPNTCAKPALAFFRGGAYKPRTSPYSFQGMGEEGLKIMAEIRDQFGLLIVTEAVDNESLELVDAVCRRDPDRRAQHAELFSAEESRAARESRSC